MVSEIDNINKTEIIYPDSDGQPKELSGLIGEGEMQGWVSPRLGIRFTMEQELKLYHPNNEIFSTYTEEKQRAQKLAAKLRELGLNPDKI